MVRPIGVDDDSILSAVEDTAMYRARRPRLLISEPASPLASSVLESLVVVTLTLLITWGVLTAFGVAL